MRLAFRVTPPFVLSPPCWEYPPFLKATATDRELSIHVQVHDEPMVTEPARLTRLFATGDGWVVDRMDDGSWCFSMAERTPAGTLLWRALGRPPFAAWELHCPPPPGGRTRIDHLIQYPLDQVLLSHSLYHHEGLLLHGAGVAIGGQSVVFPGVSGAGKSTLMGLLAPHPAIIGLSDDRMLLRRQGTRFKAYGTPWAGDARIARAEGHELHSLCFIRQARHCAIRPLDPGEALTRLLPVSTLAWYDESTLTAGLETCRWLLETHPCYELDVAVAGDLLVDTVLSHVNAH